MASNIHGAHKDNMAARKQLADLMFKRFDADKNGEIDASELSQVWLLNKRWWLTHSNLSGTMQSPNPNLSKF